MRLGFAIIARSSDNPHTLLLWRGILIVVLHEIVAERGVGWSHSAWRLEAKAS